MPAGAAISGQSSGELISHFAGVRIRVNGSGNLRLRWLSLDQVRSSTMAPLVMTTPNRIIPTRLGNFTEQRAQLEGQTTAIDESFRINRIVILAKVLFSEYPS